MLKSCTKTVMVTLTALALLFGLSSTALAASWSDLDGTLVDSYGVSLDQISRVSAGFPDGSWQPWRSVSRAQFAKMASAAFALDGAQVAGLLDGVGAGLSAPGSTINREQAIGVVARTLAEDQDFDLAGMKEADVAAALAAYADRVSVSAGLRAEMAYAVSRHLIKGDAAGNLAPAAAMSRIAAAALLIRAMGPRAVTVNASDNGTTITVNAGDTVQVVLKGNPTTGYGWTAVLSDEDAGILEQMGDPAYVPDSDLIGSGGTFTFSFKALKAGDALLMLVYQRSWETVPPLETFAVTVQVREAPDGTASLLDGTAWRLEGWSVSSLYPGDFEMTAAFEDGRISGKAAVNLYSGPYGASPNGDFWIGALISTLMAGSEPAMRAEGLFFELLGQARLYQLTGDRLTLLDANHNELLIFAADAGAQK